MKNVKNMMILLGLFIGLTTLMSTTCNKESNPPANPNCSGIAQVTISGFISGNYCFEKLNEYVFDQNNNSIRFGATATEGNNTYSIYVNIYTYTGTQTYNCGPDEAGYVELDMHGDQSEFYKTQSGTVTVSKADADHFEATFNVTTKGYNNKESVTLSGSVKQ